MKVRFSKRKGRYASCHLLYMLEQTVVLMVFAFLNPSIMVKFISTPTNNLPGRTAKLLRCNCEKQLVICFIKGYMRGVETELIGTMTPSRPAVGSNNVKRSVQTEYKLPVLTKFNPLIKY